jgi:hypothetical protein
MQQTVANTGIPDDEFLPSSWGNSPSPSAPSFAGLLASLAAPVPKTAWNTDDLADDVETLSYEHALRNHSRNNIADTGSWSFAPDAGSESFNAGQGLQEDSGGPIQTANLSAAHLLCEKAEPKTAAGDSGLFDRNLKCASITIRLSKAECEQLRSRAAQAGLTVSAYLRSCTFEAEALRAQVKDVLAEMRKAASVAKPGVSGAARRSWFEWLSRLMPRVHSGQRVQRA